MFSLEGTVRMRRAGGAYDFISRQRQTVLLEELDVSACVQPRCICILNVKVLHSGESALLG